MSRFKSKLRNAAKDFGKGTIAAGKGAANVATSPLGQALISELPLGKSATEAAKYGRKAKNVIDAAKKGNAQAREALAAVNRAAKAGDAKAEAAKIALQNVNKTINEKTAPPSDNKGIAIAAVAGLGLLGLFAMKK